MKRAGEVSLYANTTQMIVTQLLFLNFDIQTWFVWRRPLQRTCFGLIWPNAYRFALLSNLSKLKILSDVIQSSLMMSSGAAKSVFERNIISSSLLRRSTLVLSLWLHSNKRTKFSPGLPSANLIFPPLKSGRFSTKIWTAFAMSHQKSGLIWPRKGSKDCTITFRSSSASFVWKTLRWLAFALSFLSYVVWILVFWPLLPLFLSRYCHEYDSEFYFQFCPF